MSDDLNEGVDPIAEQQAFLAANAEYFAQAMSPLNELFRNSGTMNIVSEEQEYTVVVGIKEVDEEGAADVDCATLEPNQQSLRDCLNALFI
ncbi:hypothetical protein HW115_09400 [Verrucomicrobiaceae bacterium N1E253]|uniref:Uncharacterized protein n=1 Tax=Oceaniferula marina TaxID=2748318 RepID=A0A851GKX6_9BACT|nr:hypothetical protein [Oceaniferula marina]NWK55825.1 hypothetical protein [Oceaniferula marina]